MACVEQKINLNRNINFLRKSSLECSCEKTKNSCFSVCDICSEKQFMINSESTTSYTTSYTTSTSNESFDSSD